MPAALLAFAAATSAAAQVKRIGPPTSPIPQAAIVPVGTDIMYVSGITPPPVNAGAPAGTAAQPNKTARIISQVAALVVPGMMVETEAQAAKPKK